MPLEFEFPDTGEGVTEGTFLEWLVEEGEEVEEDQAVAEVETDKAVVDVPAPASGTIKELKVEPGDKVEVGQVILVMNSGDQEVEEDETEDEEKEKDDGKAGEEKSAKKDSSGEESVDRETSNDSGDVLALPKVRKLAEEKGVDIASIETEGRVTEEDVENAAEEDSTGEEVDQKSQEENEELEEEPPENDVDHSEQKKVLATPAVRKLAREKGLNIQEIEGTGRGGKITREDVLSAAEEDAKADEKDVETKSIDKQQKDSVEREPVKGDTERVELSNIRKTIAERMENSKFTAPHVTHIDKADVTKLVELREQKKDEVEAHLTYMPFIIKAAVLALKKFPDLNAELDEEKEEIIRYGNYDFNIAVDTEEGLMVPLIRAADEKSIIELAEDIVEKAGKAREGNLSKGEMENGSFSITNVGVIGGEAFTPIINYPQVAILGIGKISETAEVVDGEVVPRMTLKLSLSYDHRVVDGATAARFVNEVIENLEDPEKMLMSL